MAFAQTRFQEGAGVLDGLQLGFMFVAVGHRQLDSPAIFHLVTHAFFKACLFLGAGSVMHGMEHGVERRATS